MLLLSSAFAAVSLILFFYSVIFVADTSMSAREDIAARVRADPTAPGLAIDRSKTSRATLLLVLVDVSAVYQIVVGQTTGGVVVDPLIVMIAAGVANALYGFMSAGLL